MPAPARIQSKSASTGSPGTTLAVTLTGAVASPDALIAGAFDGSGINKTITFTDTVNAGNFPQTDATQNLATDGDTCTVGSRQNCASGATTVTAHGTAINGIIVHEVSNLPTAAGSFVDQKVTANPTSATPSSGNTAATTVAVDYVFGFMGTSGSGNTVTHGTGYAAGEIDPLGHVFSEDLITSVTGVQAATFNCSPSDEAAVFCIAYTGTGGGGGGVTENLTGQTATFTEGTPTSALAYSPTGQTATFTEGAPGANVSYALSGQTATFTEGTIARSLSSGLTGQTATFTEGTITETTGTVIALSGQTATFSEGAVTPALSAPLTAQTATFTEGAPAAQVAHGLTTQSVTSSEGTLSGAVAYGLTAQTGSFTEGTITPQVPGNVTIALTGLQAVFSVGQISVVGLTLRVQAVVAGWYREVFRDVGDIFDILATDFSDSTQSLVPPGNPQYPLFGWMKVVPSTSPLYSFALSNEGLSSVNQATPYVPFPGAPNIYGRRRYVI